MNRPQILPGGILVALGVLFLLDTLEVVAAGDLVRDWWPIVIVVIGLARLLSRPPDLLGGGITTGVGLVILGLTLDVLDTSVLSLVWPVVLISIGGWLLLSRGRTPSGVTKEDQISAFVLFSGRELAPTSRALGGGWLFAVFGAIEVDLRGCQPATGGAHLDISAIFGGCEVTVPPGWRVRIHGPAIFGGYHNAAAKQHLSDDAPTIDVRALALFGGIDIKVW